MSRFSRFALRGSLAFLAMGASLFAQGNVTVRQVTLLPATRDVEIEIQSTQRISPETQVVTEPDRLVIDFPGAVPSAQLRTLAVNRGGVKSVRSGLFRSYPPVTRVVLDLDGPLPYQVFPSGSSVIVKLGKAQGAANSVAAAVPAPEEPPPPPPPVIEVHLQNGLMSLTAERTNLAAVLAEIRKQTALMSRFQRREQEQVVAKLGPAPTRDVVAALLNGSRYNFVLVGSDNDSSLRRLILTPKGSGMVIPATPAAYTPPPGPPARISQPQPEPENDATQDQGAQEQSGDQSNEAPGNEGLSRMDKPQSKEHPISPGHYPTPPQKIEKRICR